MSYFLFSVEIPPVPEDSHRVFVSPLFTAFSREADTKTKHISTVQKLSSNVWLFPAGNNLSLLSDLVALASKNSLAYSSLLIEGFTDLSAKKSETMQQVTLGGI